MDFTNAVVVGVWNYVGDYSNDKYEQSEGVEGMTNACQITFKVIYAMVR